MKPYIIAGLLFVTGLLVLGVVTADLLSPDQKPKAHASARAPEPRKAGGGYASSNPTDATYPAAAPTASSAGTSRLRPGMAAMMPGSPPMTPGMSQAPGSLGSAMMPGSSSPLGVSGSIGISAPPAIPVPQPPLSKSQSAMQPSVPIIQPTDLGQQTSPTAAKSHQ